MAKQLPQGRETIFSSPRYEHGGTKGGRQKNRVTIAVAKDEAFNFYYQDNLEILKHLGAKLVTFSPLRDKELPDRVDGLYIGGGFPELFALKLSKNMNLRRSIYQKAECGLPIYAECGGLMYLVKDIIDFKNRRFPMVGIFNCSVRMGEGLSRLGYVKIRVIRDNILSKKGRMNRAHLFHWSRLTNIPNNSSFAYKIMKGEGNIFYDGLIRGSVLAGYAHLHFATDKSFAENFIHSCRRYKIGDH
jgi:cobyrinic acid a,c-diamide synthase